VAIIRPVVGEHHRAGAVRPPATIAGFAESGLALALAVALALGTLVTGHAGLAAAQAGPIDGKDRDAPLDVDLDDRVDPVRPGEEIVYEVEIENFTSQIAPDVVLTDVLPPGTTFVVAHREPDWAEVPAQVFADRVEFDLGGVDPCDRPGVPRCRDIWLTLRIDPGIVPGTRLENRAAVESSNAASYPTTEASTITAVGSAAIRKATLAVGHPGRDRAIVEADLARTGLRTRIDPPTATIDLAGGLRVRLVVPAGPALLDVTVPAASLRCSNPSGDPYRFTNCSVRDRPLLASAGVQSLKLTLPALVAVQRNNARVRLRANRLSVAAGSDGVELTIEAGGEIYSDAVPLLPSANGRSLRYARGQGDP
jgi:uncharacterized repeat protein (TIGR01451 family)